MVRIFFLLCLLLAGSDVVHAQTPPPTPPEITELALTASVEEEIAPDRMIASLRYSVKDDSAMGVQDQINKTMQDAVPFIKQDKAITLSTGHYMVYEERPSAINPATGKPFDGPVVWHGSQSITLEASPADKAKILTHVARLQEMGFSMDSLSFHASAAAQDKVRDDLLVRTLGILKARAEKAGAALARPAITLRSVSVDAAPVIHPVFDHRMMARAEMASSAIAEPVAEAGTHTVSMTVSATIWLK